MAAARYNQNPDVITALINAGADIHARTENGWTAMMMAARELIFMCGLKTDGGSLTR